MRTAVRLIAIQNFVISLVFTLFLVGLAIFFSSGEKLKSYISESGVYPFVAVQISKSLKNADTPINVVIQGSSLEKIVNKLIDDTVFWVSNQEAKAPEVSLIAVAEDLGIKDVKDLQEFMLSQKDVLEEMKNSPEMAQGDSEEMMQMFESLSKNGGVYSLEKQLGGLKVLVRVFPILLIMSIGLAVLSIAFIVLLTPTWKNKTTWFFVTGLFTSIALALTATIFRVPQQIIPMAMSTNTDLPEGAGQVIQSVLLPVLDSFATLFTVALVVSGVLTAVLLFARLLLFSSPAALPKKQNKK